MLQRETTKTEELNGHNVLKVITYTKGYGFGAKWTYLKTRYFLGGVQYVSKKAVKQAMQQPQHAEVRILKVGEATKPTLNPAIEAEMRELGLA